MRKSTIIAIAVFGLLVVGLIVATTRKAERGISRISYESVAPESVTRIEITGKHEVELAKQDDLWTVASAEGRRADSKAVERLLEAIPKIQSSDMVTENDERYGELEVDAEKGIGVKVYAGKSLAADFTVGKGASGGVHIRVDDAVYAVDKVYPSLFDREPNKWIERELFDTEMDEVAKVTVDLAEGEPFTLSKTDDNWQLEDMSVLPEGFRFDHAAARRVVTTLVNLKAREVLLEDPGADATGLDGEVDSLTLHPSEGEPSTLRLGGNKDKQVYARVDQGDVVLLNSSNADNLRKAPTDFREMTMVDIDPAKVTELTVVDGSARLVLAKKGAEWSVATSTDEVPGDFELDEAAVTRRLNQMKRAKAKSLAEGVTAAAAGLTRPSAEITAELEEGESVTLAFGREVEPEDGAKVVYAQGNIDDAVYAVSPGTKRNVLGMLETFKKRSQPPGMGNIDPSALSGLPPDVRKQLQQQIKQKQMQQQIMQQMQQRKAKAAE